MKIAMRHIRAGANIDDVDEVSNQSVNAVKLMMFTYIFRMENLCCGLPIAIVL